MVKNSIKVLFGNDFCDYGENMCTVQLSIVMVHVHTENDVYSY